MKNISTYFLAKGNGFYTQYITDASEERFKVALSLCNSASQLLVQRDGQLMYYLYVRQVGSQETFGMCIVVNGMMATNLSRMFDFFEHAYEKVVLKGKVLGLDRQGNPIIILKDFTTEPLEMGLLEQELQESFAQLQGTIALPPANMATTITDFRNFELESLTAQEIQQTAWHSWTLIRKQTDYESENFAGYRRRLSDLSHEIANLEGNKAQLVKQLSQLNREKKQMKWVIAMSCAILIGGIIAFLTINNKNATISSQSSQISLQDEEINNQRDNISTLYYEIRHKNYEISSLRAELNSCTVKRDSLTEVLKFLQNDYQRLKNENAELIEANRDLYQYYLNH